MNDKMVKVGVGLLVLKDGKVLWSKRKGSFGAGLWGGIGGHVEYGETLEQAILRELAEECGITVKNVCVLCVSDFLTHSPKHYVDVGFVADWEAGEPHILEPDKCDGWEWRAIDDIPEHIFAPMAGYIEAYKTGKNYFTYPAGA
ncbi:MAG TPA: NUDIX domain-containing protein [Candidatus Saccharimonadales bacterium]|nr:NUDIX domain-containing protein [Candidatus Saccharimonadales bacterium]